MNMKQKVAAGSLAVALALGGVAALAGPAVAHTPTITADCEGLVMHGDYYDSNKVNEYSYKVGDADTVSVNFGSSFGPVTIPIPQGGATTHVVAEIHDADNTAAYSETFDEKIGPCGKAAPKDVTINPVVVNFTCDAGTTYTVPEQPDQIKYALDSVTGVAPVPGTYPLAAGATVDIKAHLQAQYAGDYNPVSYDSGVITGASTNTLDCHAPQTCTVTGTPYTEDGFPDFTADGLQFGDPDVSKPAPGHALNWLVPVSGNLQGFTTASYTISAATGYHAAFRFVLLANGNSGYTSVTAEPYLNGWVAGQTGTFTITPATLVWNSHILSGPGSQGSPVSITDMAALIPSNQLQAEGIHSGSGFVAGQSTTVGQITGCVTYNHPVAPDPIPSITTDTGDVDCSVEGGGSYVITTHHFLTYPKFVAPASFTFDGQEPVKSGEDTYQTIEVGTEVCPQFVTPEAPTAADFCGVSKDTLTLPGVVDGNESETANAHYTVTENTGTSITVVADPFEGVAFNEPGDGDTYTLDEGSAVWHFTFNNDACKLPPTTLAATGVPIGMGATLALILLGIGVRLHILGVRRRNAQQ